MSQNTTKFVICYNFKLTTCFGPCCGPSSGHKSIYSRKLYSISHKIYQSKIQRDLFVVQYSNDTSLYVVEISRYVHTQTPKLLIPHRRFYTFLWFCDDILW